ncbi:hypothetical protein FFWV33_03350 [Flavobacterium faecale]|uniref:Uncharacterized protein n=1 Tax=Flavobacterium faecale TaxID=1355330 RepID=A0A2S1LA54_9FLAO|nr:T9SS sorting signal type C domain-containing protein [Flavobacterium faecale]AWG20639.1 hypothetical protein FFWV33_03350 [Flavobacterium faecale]
MKAKLLYILLLFSLIGSSQTIIFSENFLNAPSSTPYNSIAAHTFQNSGTSVTFSGTADARSTDPSDNIGASGNGNIFFTNSTPTLFEIANIDTSNYSNITLALNHFKSQNSISNELLISVSSDGINYTPLSYSRATGALTSNWLQISPTGLIPTTTNLRIRFTSAAAGTYWFRIDDLKLSGTKICLSSTSWNGSAWSNGLPDNTSKAIINANYNTATNGTINACSVTVANGASITVGSNDVVKIQNGLTVNGTLTFNNNSSLIQINDNPVIPNTGSINYKRQTTQISNFDFTYWSSPVQGQTLYNLSPGTLYDKYFSLNAATNSWTQENSNNTMTLGKGYIIRGPQSYSTGTPGFYEGTFIGVPNNGIVTVPFGAGIKANLIGNPYPSAVDAEAFISTNSGVIFGTLYFWTHNSSFTTSRQYDYTADDYAAYNLMGGTAAASGGVTPTRAIAAGQGFIAFSMTAGSATFNNSMRMISGTTIDNSKFFRPANDTKTAKTSLVESKSRLWLNLTNEQGAFKQLLVGYAAGATNGYDASYDGWNYNANPYINFYSINENQNFSIQGRAVDTQSDDSIPLGYSSTIKGNFQITIDNVDGNLSEKDIYLTDQKNAVEHNLKSGPYTFSTEAGTFNDRFQLSYQAKTTLGVTATDLDQNKLLISQKENTITIHSNSEQINEVRLYDLAGREILSRTKVNSTDLQLAVPFKNAQVLLIKVKLENGQIITEKLVIN